MVSLSTSNGIAVSMKWYCDQHEMVLR